MNPQRPWGVLQNVSNDGPSFFFTKPAAKPPPVLDLPPHFCSFLQNPPQLASFWDGEEDCDESGIFVDGEKVKDEQVALLRDGSEISFRKSSSMNYLFYQMD
eukprot:CAMPEP_0201500712 /NCGR_PEP_ID=MMETSP0151_2-20130828/82934_1 /ASSEMBLY_ACC=CAM_ASM_000257 /TAXON_ID=200890 /ORGANISM="Paramoeba atlantica, Strain 621/1 / CCAP 1560/9" /LENGTH=101 /DNA_ID=CAMNT_0047894137 /DNA_START=41 /DNA_END=343 /DNA_ORIENTATION=+